MRTDRCRNAKPELRLAEQHTGSWHGYDKRFAGITQELNRGNRNIPQLLVNHIGSTIRAYSAFQ